MWKIAQPSDEGDDRRRDDADARLVLPGGFADRDVDDEKRNGETDSGQRRAACDPAQPKPRCQLPESGAAHEPRRTGDADELAKDQTGDDAPRQRRARRGAQARRVESDPGVDQREQRQHQERDVGPDVGLQALVDGNRLAQTAGGRAGILRSSATAEMPGSPRRHLRPACARGRTPESAARARHRRASDGYPPDTARPTARSPAPHTPARGRQAETAPVRSRSAAGPTPPAVPPGSRRSRRPRSRSARPTSSTTASVSRKIRRRPGNFGLMMASAPTRKAVSVEITTPHAWAFSPDGFSNRKMTAGSASPATAATTGTAALDRSVSSPILNSRVTSSPTMKKKNVIKPSLIRCLTDMSK